MTKETIKFKINEGTGRASTLARYIESNVDDVEPEHLVEGETLTEYEVTVTVREIGLTDTEN